MGLDKFDENIIKTFYHNISSIYNFSCLIDNDNFKKTNEAQNKIKFEKLNLVSDIIKKLGFNYQLKDRNNIFRCDKCNLKEYYNEPENKEDYNDEYDDNIECMHPLDIGINI